MNTVVEANKMNSVTEYSTKLVNNLLVHLPILGGTTLLRSVCTVGSLALNVFSAFPCLGLSESLNFMASLSLSKCESRLLSNVYTSVLNVVNPYAQYERAHDTATFIIIEESGICGKEVSDRIFKEAQEAASSSDPLVKHGVSRLIYLSGATIGTVSRVADIGVGLVASVASILPYFGTNKKINNFAIAQLNSFVLQDLCNGIRGVINPQSVKLR